MSCWKVSDAAKPCSLRTLTAEDEGANTSTSLAERAATALTASCIIDVLPLPAGPRIAVTKSLESSIPSTAACPLLYLTGQDERGSTHSSLARRGFSHW